MHESLLWPSSVFVTLSYAPEHLTSLSLEYPDFQSFMKRLRRRYDGAGDDASGGRPIRFFCAAEYGDRYQRPHFHAILFNFVFPDQCGPLADGSYRSNQAEDVWSKGHVHIGAVTPQSAAYVAGYTLEKVHGYGSASYYDVADSVTGEVIERRAPFVTMSRRPGIGAGWFEKYSGDLLPHDFAVTADGRKARVPRYYLQRYAETAEDSEIEGIRYRRYERARLVPREESSEARRMVREEVAYLRTAFFQRRDH